MTKDRWARLVGVFVGAEMSTDPQERMLDALTDATKAQSTTARRIDSLERKFESLETTLNTRMERLENEMGTMNAHLDNLVREAQITNQLLRDANDERKAEAERKLKIEEDERQHRQELEKDQRNTYKHVVSEIWSMFKHPLGLLIAGIVAWLLYSYFAVPTAKLEMPVPEVQNIGGN
jgi:septal ring factor EnvC (AmiA/AmiB activator)